MDIAPEKHSTAQSKAERLQEIRTHPGLAGRRVKQLGIAGAALASNRLLHRPVTVPLGAGSRIRADARFHNSMSSAYFRIPEYGPYRFWQSVVRPGDHVVDVGANVGVVSLLLTEMGARVTAVEADRTAFAELNRNLALNDASVTTFCVAISDQVGLIRFSQGRDASNAVLVDAADEGTPVLAVDLDTLIGDQPTAGIKVDVEGAERLVLEGAEGLLTRQRPVVQLEWNRMSERCLDETRAPSAALLGRFDYVVCHIGKDGSLTRAADPAANQSDIIAVPAERVGGTGTDVTVLPAA